MKHGGVTDWYFLRGLVREGAHWGHFLENFAQVNPGVRTHTLNIPGSGPFFREESPTSVEEMTNSCRNQLEFKTDRKTPQFLVAISMGGMIALDWLTRFPGDFSGAVIINSSVRGLSTFTERFRPQALLPILKVITAGNLAKREQMILELTSNRPSRILANLPKWVEIQRQHTVSKRNAIRQLFAAARFEASAQPPKTPVLVLSSKGDRLVSYQASAKLAEFVNGELVLHETAGHDLPLDEPQWTVEKIQNWYHKNY